jgi:hypothetical protein
MDWQTKSDWPISVVTNAMRTRDLDRAPVQPSWQCAKQTVRARCAALAQMACAAAARPST